MNATASDRNGFFRQMMLSFKRPDQSARDFKTELDALTEKDKLDFWKMLNRSGFPCDPPISNRIETSPPAAA